MDTDWFQGFATFFTVITAVSGTIFAILFVAIQFAAQAWRDKPLRLYAAVMTLIELAAPLLIGLVTLHPAHCWQFGAVVVAAVGGGSVVGYFWLYFRLRHHSYINWYDHFRALLGIPVLTVVYGILVASVFVDDERNALNWVAGDCIWLVLSGVTQSWLLVVLSVWRTGTPPTPPDGAAAAL